MKSIQKFLKAYLNQKIKNENLNLIINFLLIGLSFLIIIIKIEESAYFSPYTKNKISSIIFLLYSLGILFLILKSIIHIYNLGGNSNSQTLAYQLINKIPTKDRIINALQIYSKLDLNSPYSDLTINAINELESDIKKININKINFNFPYRKLYFLITLFLIIIKIREIINELIFRIQKS